MKRIWVNAVSLCCVAMMMAGCYQTQVRSMGVKSTGEVHEAREWFTVGGLVSTSSGTAGAECGKAGLASVKSGQSGTDVLIIFGLGVLGALLAPSACDDVSSSERAQCMSLMGTLPAFLIAPRTVSYECAR